MRIFRDNLSTFTHWFGWTMAILASALFIVFDLRDWVLLLIQGSGIDQIWFYSFLLLAISGAVVSLFKRIPGGYMMLAGGVGMVVFYYTKSGWMESGTMIVYGLPYILPAFLLLVVKK